MNGYFGKISLSLLGLNLFHKAMSSDKYILQEVVDARTEREFLDLPRKIYKGNRNWVCPLDPSIQAVFDPKKNEMFSDGEAIRWIARDKKGEVVGRIAAFYDREHAFLEEQPTGGCGFFEAINDQELADQLFDAARPCGFPSPGYVEAMDGSDQFRSPGFLVGAVGQRVRISAPL